MPKLKVKYTLLTLFPHLGPLLVISPLALTATWIPCLRSGRKGEKRQGCHSSTLAGAWQKGTGQGEQVAQTGRPSLTPKMLGPAWHSIAALPIGPRLLSIQVFFKKNNPPDGACGPWLQSWDKRQPRVPHLKRKNNFLQPQVS